MSNQHLIRLFHPTGAWRETFTPLEEELERFFSLSIDLLCIAGFDGYFRRVNPAFERVLGYSADALVARPFLDYVHPDDRAQTLSEMEKLRGGVPTVAFENRYRRADGSYVWLAWTSMPVRDDGLLYAVARDMTEQKQLMARVAEAEIAAQRLAVLQATMRTVHDIVNNYLNSVLVRDQADGVLPPDSVALFDRLIAETTAKLTALSDLTTVTEESSPAGARIKFEND